MMKVPAEPSARASIRVLIVEEQEVIRRGLLAITSSIPEVAASAVAKVSAEDAGMLAETDVTLISTSTLVNVERAGSSVDCLRPMIVIVPSLQLQQLEIATRRPADGYIMQTELTPSSLQAALARILNGRLVVPDAIAAYLLSRVRDDDIMPWPQLHHLTPREAEVLTLLVAGASNKEIAVKLRISVHGVKRHVSTLLSRFHSPSRVHLVSLVLRSGMVPPQDVET
jgi:two-component system, NarL family, nitrate/nitrite response regulator NarL